MKLKSWMVKKVNGMDDPGPREPQIGAEAREPRMSAIGERRGSAVPRDVENLGPYRTLIGAIREELEHFVRTQLRLHLAIAERDRYVLASVEVECDESDEHRELLRRFIGEFKPEQIKHYLAKEVIAGLRNASAIDLSQFAGLNAAQQDGSANEDTERYGELLAELRRGSPQSIARPYRVTLLGRWSQLDTTAPVSERSSPGPGNAQTPLSTQAFAIDIEDAGGAHRVDLPSVVPGRRYAVGKGEGCDIVVDGAYASRRHCEMWFDKGTWWVVDTGSTNGIRVESANGVIARCHQREQGEAPPRGHRVGGRRAVGARRAYRRRAAAVSAIVAPPDRCHRRPRERDVADTRNADCSAASARRGDDDHRPHGIGRALRRHCRGRASISRGSFAQSGARHRPGARRRLRSPFRNRRARRVGCAGCRSRRQRGGRRRNVTRAGHPIQMEARGDAAARRRRPGRRPRAR